MSHLSDATVLSVRPVTIDGMPERRRRGRRRDRRRRRRGQRRGDYNARLVAGLLGAVVGGVIGNAIERGATTQNGVELLLQMRNGERRSIVQANGNEGWMVGEPVVLVTTGGRTRVTRAPQVGAQPVPQAYPAPQATRCRRRCRPPVPVYPQSGPVPPRS